MNDNNQSEVQINNLRKSLYISKLKPVKENELTPSQHSINNLSKIESENNEQNEELQEEQLEKQFEVFYLTLIEMYQKAQYKKLIQSINQKKLTFISSQNYWKINHLKIISIIKIIERKLLKYHNDQTISNISISFRYLEKEIILWIESLEELIKDDNITEEDISTENPKPLYIEEKTELLITYILAQCYLYARFCIHQQMISDCIGFLALGERLIIHTSNFFLSPDSAHYARLIYSFLTSLLIADNNFDSAKNYISAILKIAYKELEIRLKGEMRFLVNLEEYNKIEKDNLYDIILSITIAFFHLGVCYENEFDLNKSYQAYQQARWFGQYCKLNKVTAFTYLLSDIEKRSLFRKELIEFFHKEEANIPVSPIKEKKKPKAVYDEEQKEKRFEEIEAFISKLPLTEIDDEDADLLNKVNKKPFSRNVSFITKTVHVLNYLMSDKFKNVIDNMKRIEINCLDKETKRTIQKRILFLKNTQRMKLFNQMKEKSPNPNETPKEPTDNNNNNQKELYHKIYKEDKKYINNRKKLRSLPNTIRQCKAEKTKLTLTNETYLQTAPTSITQNSPLCTMQNRYQSPRYPIKLQKDNKVLKLKHNKYIFNPRFREKVAFLNMQFNKELKFQKDVLKCKEGEKQFSFEPFNERKVRHNCDNFFNQTLEIKMKEAIEREKILEKTELSKKALSVSKKMKQTFTSRFVRAKSLIAKPKIIEYTRDVSDRNNQTYLNTIQGNLDKIQQKEKMYNNAFKKLRSGNVRKKKKKND